MATLPVDISTIKHNVILEVYDNVKVGRIYKNGVLLKCASKLCDNNVYVKSSNLLDGKVHTCSIKCKNDPDIIKLYAIRFNSKYGVSNPFSLPSVKLKIANTNLMRYGHSNAASSIAVKSKIKQTWLDKYGVDNPQKNPDIRQKTVKTLHERYGGNLIGFCKKDTYFETNLRKYGSKYFFSSSAGAMSLDNFKKRYGDDGESRYHMYINSKKQTLSSFIDRYGTELGVVKYTDWVYKATNYRYRLERIYGNDVEKINSIIRKSYKLRLRKALRRGKYSKLNDKIFNMIKNIPIIYDIKREFNIRGSQNYFYYDFLINDKLILEVNGDYWHCNPVIYTDPNAKVLFPGGVVKTPSQVWEYDRIKKQSAVSAGYDTYTIWERDVHDPNVVVSLITKLQTL